MDPGIGAVSPSLIAVLAAALLGFAIGGVWYGPLFGRVWMHASGMTEEQARGGNALRIYGLTFVLNLVAAFLFEHRPLRLWLINSGDQVLLFTAMGRLLGAWS